MKGELCHEVEVAAAAEKVWAIYGTHEIGKLLPTLVPHAIEKVECEGDGGAGSTMKVFHTSDIPGPKSFKEEFVKVDHEKRVKEAKQVEGGFLAMGFLSYVVRFEIVEKGSDACAIKYTIDYDAGEGASVEASVIVTALTDIAQAVAKHLGA
jgi:hypothetical protein